MVTGDVDVEGMGLDSIWVVGFMKGILRGGTLRVTHRRYTFSSSSARPYPT